MRNSIIKLFVLSTLCSVFLFACGSVPPKDGKESTPSWILGQSAEFPSARFITGVGQGDSLSDAKERARAEIAKVFEISIESNSIDSSSFSRTSGTEAENRHNSSSVERNIKSHTNQIIQGIEISESWFDKTSSTYYSLANLKRSKAQLSIRNRINELDSATFETISTSQKADLTIQQIRLLSRAIDLQYQRHNLNKQLAVISLTGENIPSKWTLEQLIAKRSELLGSIEVAVYFDNNPRLQNALKSTLANHGMNVYDSAEYLIDASMHREKIEPQQGWYYSYSSLAITIKKWGKVLGGQQWSFKSSATDKNLLKAREFEEAEKILNKQLIPVLFEKIAN